MEFFLSKYINRPCTRSSVKNSKFMIMEIFENLTLKIADNLRDADFLRFMGFLLKKIMPFLVFKKLLNDHKISKLEYNKKRNSPLLFANKKSVLSISLLGSNNANEDDNSRISCGHSQKTVSSFKGRGIINLNYIHSAIYTKDAISIYGANSKDCVKVKSSQVNTTKKNFSKKRKTMFPALVALTLLTACSNTDIGNQEENQTCLNSSSIVRNSSSKTTFDDINFGLAATKEAVTRD